MSVAEKAQKVAAKHFATIFQTPQLKNTNRRRITFPEKIPKGWFIWPRLLPREWSGSLRVLTVNSGVLQGVRETRGPFQWARMAHKLWLFENIRLCSSSKKPGLKRETWGLIFKCRTYLPLRFDINSFFLSFTFHFLILYEPQFTFLYNISCFSFYERLIFSLMLIIFAFSVYLINFASNFFH